MSLKKLFLPLVAFLLLFASLSFGADKWLQPPAVEGMDTWFGSYYNKTAQFDGRDRVGGWGDYYYSVLRFNLSGLPLVPTRVLLWRYSFNDGGTPTSINWFIPSTQWQTNTIGYNNRPNLYAFTYISSPAPALGTWTSVDITGLYYYWRQGGVWSGGSQYYLNYGLFLSPQLNNNNYSSFYSSRTAGYGPQLQVTYNTTSNDSKIQLKWPLGTNNTARTVSGYSFGVPWIDSCGGKPKLHTGTDYTANAGWTVYAPEDGIVKQILLPSQTGGWMSNIVIEHNTLTGGKFTTVIWHINQPTVKVGDFVPKGMPMATIANLSSGAHMHFGLRLGAYNAAVYGGTYYAGVGGLPQMNCQDANGTWYPQFTVSGFINTQDVSQVLFQ